MTILKLNYKDYLKQTNVLFSYYKDLIYILINVDYHRGYQISSLVESDWVT